MSRHSWGKKTKENAKKLLIAVLEAGNLPEGIVHLHLTAMWVDKNNLIVEATRRALEEITGLTAPQIRAVFEQLEEIKILKPTKVQGKHKWKRCFHFCSQEQVDIINQFENLWEKKRTEIRSGADNKKIDLIHNDNLIDEVNDLYSPKIIWGDSPAINAFFGREEEIKEIEQWIINQKAKIVGIFGLKGEGKTTLSLSLFKAGLGKTELSKIVASRIRNEFEFIIWRSLENAPHLQDELHFLIKTISNHNKISINNTLEENIQELILQLKKRRCLVILDNLESILKTHPETKKIEYKDRFNDYDYLLKKISESEHNSCFLINSREKPSKFVSIEKLNNKIFSLELRGLEGNDALKIFKLIQTNSKIKFSHLTVTNINRICEIYGGNPLALQLVAIWILDLPFLGNIDKFLGQNNLSFPELETILDWHFERLTNQEKEIIYWITLNRVGTSYDELYQDIINPSVKKNLASSIQALGRKFLLDTSIYGFRLQPVLKEYLTNKIIQTVLDEIKLDGFHRSRILNYLALSKASSKEFIRESQNTFIVIPIVESLIHALNGQENLKNKIFDSLHFARKNWHSSPGYLASNLIKLLSILSNGLLENVNLSNLYLCQLNFQDILLSNVNFSGCFFDKCKFLEKFGNVFSVSFAYFNSKKILAFGSASNHIHLWDCSEEKYLGFLSGHTNWVRSISSLGNSPFLISSSDDTVVKLWNLETKQCILNFYGHSSAVRTVAYSPNGLYIASGGGDGKVIVWNLEDASIKHSLSPSISSIWSVKFSFDSRFIATSNGDGEVEIWEVASGESIRKIRNYGSTIWSLAFARNASLLAGAGEDNIIYIWNYENGDCLAQLEGHKNQIRSLCFSPDDKYLASGGGDYIIRIWNMNTLAVKLSLVSHTTWIRSLDFSLDGEFLVSGSSDQSILIWDYLEGNLISAIRGYTNQIRSIDLSYDNKFLLAGSEDMKISIWDLQSKKIIIEPIKVHLDQVRSVSFSSKSNVFATASSDYTVKIWSIEEKENLYTIKEKHCLNGHELTIWSVKFSPDGKLLVTGSEDRSIKIWDVETGACLYSFLEHNSWVWTVSFSPNNLYIASAGHDGTIRIRFRSSPKEDFCNFCVFEKQKGWIKSVDFDPTSHLIASGGEDCLVHIWDITKMNHLYSLEGHDSSVSCVRFLSANLVASASDDCSIKIWDIDKGCCTNELIGHEAPIKSIVVKDNYLISAGDDETIMVWSLEDMSFQYNLRTSRPYENANLSNVKGISQEQLESLKMLGVVQNINY